MCRLSHDARRSSSRVRQVSSHCGAYWRGADSLRWDAWGGADPALKRRDSMPPVIALLGTLAPIITAAGAAATVGDTIYNATQGGGGGASQTQNTSAQAQQTLQAQQAAQQKDQAIKAQLSNAQEKTGGSLTTPGLTDLASILAGYGGQAGGSSPTPFSP